MFTDWLIDLALKVLWFVVRTLWEFARLLWDALRNKREVSRANAQLRKHQRADRAEARQQRVRENPSAFSPFSGENKSAFDEKPPQLPRSSSPFNETAT